MNETKIIWKKSIMNYWSVFYYLFFICEYYPIEILEFSNIYPKKYYKIIIYD